VLRVERESARADSEEDRGRCGREEEERGAPGNRILVQLVHSLAYAKLLTHSHMPRVDGAGGLTRICQAPHSLAYAELPSEQACQGIVT